MNRPYLKVTPGGDVRFHKDIPETIASLHKISRSTSESLVRRLNPLQRQPPIRYEFVAISEGEGEPVEFYYGADDHLDVLEQRLRTIYPPTYTIERTESDFTRRLIPPVEFSREEYMDRVKEGRLYRDSDDSQSAVSDGGELEEESPSQQSSRDSRSTPESTPTSDTETAVAPDGSDPLADSMASQGDPVRARPPISEVEPYGVEWWATADRRKDWMTPLTEFTDVLETNGESEADQGAERRYPLTPLITQLLDAPAPMAFQVVFQRRPDWSTAARRRSGELLNGTDTLLHRLLAFGSSGPRRTESQTASATGHRNTPQKRTLSVGGPSQRIAGEGKPRYELIQANSPDRTFSVNLRLLTLVADDEQRDKVTAFLEPIAAVFDTLDGNFYEVDGRRLRSRGIFPGSGDRHASSVLDLFTGREIATGGRRFTITNRSESRPDFVLNGDELANFLIIPPSVEMPEKENESQEGYETDAGSETEVLERVDDIDKRETASPSNEERDARQFQSIPETLLHRDNEIERLSSILSPDELRKTDETVIITGPPGSGKTSTAKYTVDQLRREYPAIEAGYVNCWEDHSSFQILYRILDEFEDTTHIHRQSTPTDVVLERLREYDNRSAMLILDEVDQLDDDLLYDILNLPGISVILILNKEADLFEGLDERLESRLRGCERISFTPYTGEELQDILATWSKQELESVTIDSSEIGQIAAAADGDARVAITTLRIAARQTDQASHDRITRETVNEALPDARQEVQYGILEELTPHQQTVLQIVQDHGRITPGELYQEYQTRVDEPKTDRTVRNYLQELERLALIATEGSSRDRVYRCTNSVK
jgi:orc1/cdc6 family replication initiation protein